MRCKGRANRVQGEDHRAGNGAEAAGLEDLDTQAGVVPGADRTAMMR